MSKKITGVAPTISGDEKKRNTVGKYHVENPTLDIFGTRDAVSLPPGGKIDEIAVIP